MVFILGLPCFLSCLVLSLLAILLHHWPHLSVAFVLLVMMHFIIPFMCIVCFMHVILLLDPCVIRTWPPLCIITSPPFSSFFLFGSAVLFSSINVHLLHINLATCPETPCQIFTSFRIVLVGFKNASSLNFIQTCFIFLPLKLSVPIYLNRAYFQELGDIFVSAKYISYLPDLFLSSAVILNV